MNSLKKIFIAVLVFSFPLTVFAQSPNDPFLDKLWYLNKIHAQDAWETTTGDDSVVVAVLDTGIDLDHPDLVGNIWENKDEIVGDGLDNDGNGYIDDVEGWDFVDNDANPTPVDAVPFDVSAVTHGTLVAGIISAIGNNSEGIAGVSWNTKLMPLRILDRAGSGTERSAIAAIDYAVENGADVINLSFTGRDIGQTFVMSVKRAYEHGVVFVAAVGNDGRTNLANLNNDPVYPACLKGVSGDDWVIGVASTTQLDEKADFSNYGRNCTDIAAPGVDMFGTYFQNSGNPYFQNYYGGYWQGTSASTPVVSGAAALLLSRFPSLTPAKVKTIIQLAADPIVSRGTAWFGQLGSGRLNIARAVEIAPAFAPPVIRGKTRTPIIFSAGPGYRPEVNIFNADGEHTASYLVYDEKFTGGVSAMVDDIDHDGEAEFAVVPRSNGNAHVRWFELDGKLRGQFVAFDGKLGGFSIASGDSDADGNTEIVVASLSGEPRLQVYDISGGLERELSLENNSGYTIRLGDVDGLVGDEIVLAPVSGPPAVTILRGDGSILNVISVAAPSQTMGLNLALGDIDDNGRKEVLIGLKGGGEEQVRGFTYQGALVQSFLTGKEGSVDGVKVSVGDVDGDGNDDVFVMSDRNQKEMKVYKNQKLDLSWGVSEAILGDTEISTWTF